MSYQCSFGQLQIDPLSAQRLLQVGLSSVSQPQRTAASTSTEFQLARSHEGGQGQASVYQSGLHARPFVDVEEAADEVRSVDKGQPVTCGVEAENIVFSREKCVPKA